MKEDFSVPEEFEQYSKLLFAKDTITQREFIDFCLSATTLVDNHWDNRQGLAYHIAGAWLKYKNLQEDNLLDQIGALFGELELPDNHAAQSEEDVRRKWDEVRQLVVEASEEFAEHKPS